MTTLLIILTCGMMATATVSEEEHERIYQEYLETYFPPRTFDLTPRALTADPQLIHLSWRHPVERSITVAWLTAGSGNPAQVRYGLTASYELGTITGTTATSPFSGYLHSADFTELTPATTYHYTVSPDPGGAWSPDATFSTGPAPPVAFSFVACGDSRQMYPWPAGNLLDWNSVLRRMVQENFNFLLFTGDMTYNGTTENYWYDWFEKTQQVAANVPVMPTIGNHELSGDSVAAHYLGMFALPENAGTERYYSFNYGDAHVAVLDSSQVNDAQQRIWLETDLSLAGNSARWIFVSFHIPPYTSGYGSGFHPPDATIQQLWVPLFDAYHVSMVFLGHNHFYERTYPLYGGSDPADPTVTDWNPTSYTDPQGTIYVICGAAGAPMVGYVPDNSAGYIAAMKQNTFHYCRISVGENLVSVDTIATDDGTTIDHFQIIKSPQEVPAVSDQTVLLLVTLLGAALSGRIGHNRRRNRAQDSRIVTP